MYLTGRMCAFARIISITRFLASFSFFLGGSFLEKKRDKKQLLSLKIKTKKY